jgi:hypothetical protein
MHGSSWQHPQETSHLQSPNVHGTPLWEGHKEAMAYQSSAKQNQDCPVQEAWRLHIGGTDRFDHSWSDWANERVSYNAKGIDARRSS